MNSLNRVMLIGNITSDIEAKQTPNGQTVCNLNIATSRQWKNSAGEKQEQTEFSAIVLWGAIANIASQYAGKGKKIYVEGHLQTRSWEDTNGQKRYKTEIIGDSLLLLSPNTGTKEPEEQNMEIEFGDIDSVLEPVSKKPVNTYDGQEINIEDIPY